MLTVADFADEAFIENADVQSGVGRRGDGVFVTVTSIGVSPGQSASGARYGDGRRGAGTGPGRAADQQVSGVTGGASNRPWAKKPINAHGVSGSPSRSR